MSSAVPPIWRARSDAGSRATTRVTAQPTVGATITEASAPSLASSRRSPEKAMLEISSETVKPIPAKAPAATSSGPLNGERLDEAKLGALASVIVAPTVGWAVTRVVARLPASLRARQIGGTAEDILDLANDVDPERDHVRGRDDAPVTLVEYGDFECPYCGQAEGVLRDLLLAHGDDVRYVWRHLPLSDVHPSAQLAAEGSEAAAAQGAFWEMHDVLLSHQGALAPRDLAGYAEQLGLDVERLMDEVRRRTYAPRVSEDVASADESGVSGTPSFFINGRRHYGVYDIATLTEAVLAAKRRAQQLLAAPA